MTGIIRIIWGILILVTPYCLGLPWKKTGGSGSPVSAFCICYVTGYFIRLALFHIIAFPVAMLSGTFSQVSLVFTCALLAVSLCSYLVGRRNNVPMNIDLGQWIKGHSRYELLYLFLFLCVVAFQVHMVIHTDITYMGYDQATYTVYGSDALETDQLFTVGEMTGISSTISSRKMFMTALIYNAWIARMTGISITTVMRTVQAVYFLLLAYAAYIFLSEDLISRRENRYIFLLFVALMYLYGYYSHYSATFRLLGPNTEGKAVVAVIMSPILYVLMRKRLAGPYDRKTGILLMIFSNAATGLSLWGTGTVPVIVGIPVVLSLIRKERRWSHLLYLGWIGFFPLIYCVMYFLWLN